MDAAVAGLIGALGAVVVTKGYDFWSERRRNDREDVVWRRQHALDAAADLLQYAGHLQVLGRTIRDYAEHVVAARQGGHVAEVGQLTDTLNRYQQDKVSTLTSANNALSRLALLLKQETYLAISLYLEAVTLRPHDPDTTGLSAHVNNLLRSDIGLPPRVIAKGEGITVDEYRAKVAEKRQEGTAAERVLSDLEEPTP